MKFLSLSPQFWENNDVIAGTHSHDDFVIFDLDDYVHFSTNNESSNNPKINATVIQQDQPPLCERVTLFE